MEKLNEYLQRLLSSCSEELRLEPNRNPFLVSESGTTDVAHVPLAGTQISTMVFPLIPPSAQAALPHSNEIEFVHPHALGNFNFTVEKSPAGFVVVVRPLLTHAGRPIPVAKPVPPIAEEARVDGVPASPTIENAVQTLESLLGSVPMAGEYSLPDSPPELTPEPTASAASFSYELESSSFNSNVGTVELDNVLTLPELITEDFAPAHEYVPTAADTPEIEIISFNDPAYETVFSDTSTYEPPGRRDDIVASAYVPAEEKVQMNQQTFAPPTPPVQNVPFEQPPMPPPVQTYAQAPAPVAESAFVPVQANAGEAAKMDALFKKMSELGASDLHMSVSVPPMVRKDGKMKPINEGMSPMSADAMKKLLTSIMPAKNQEEFAKRHDTDFAYEIPDLARFRCNVFMDRKGMGAVFRIIPTKILTAEELGLSKAIMDLCGLSKGLVVVTGPTGSGKSTTLCAMVDSINKTREDHIITIEDPIEFVHENQKCLVNQREVHNHTDSFKDALRAALREDPDILLVGEMRDLETVSIAIETAETGHLVFGTLHTTTAASTVDRIIDQFPADRQQQVRVMLSESLRGVIAQTLLPKKGGGRVAALEILIVTPAISNLIREGKTFQIPSAMQTGKNMGMVMLNDALFEHVKNGVVEPRDAYMKAADKGSFETMLTRGGFAI